MVFSAAPPISPTFPEGSMVPVVATAWPPVNEPLLKASISVRVMASPADGPPMLAVLSEIEPGREKLTPSSGATPSHDGPAWGYLAHPVADDALGEGAVVTATVTAVVRERTPDSLNLPGRIVTSSLVSGLTSTSAPSSEHCEVTAWPLIAVISSPTSRPERAGGVLSTPPVITAPVAWAATLQPNARKAATLADICESLICKKPSEVSWLLGMPGSSS